MEALLWRWSWLPSFAAVSNDEPPPSGMQKRIHWVGQKGPSEPQQGPGPEQDGGKPEQTGVYRDLSSVTLGEVDAAIRSYAPQLRPSLHAGWLAPNTFCMLHLKQHDENIPPALFGRVRACYPTDGYTQNIQELELLLPQPSRAPDVVRLRSRDILTAPDRPVQSFHLRVSFFCTHEEWSEFAGQDELLYKQGFALEPIHNYLDLLEVNEQNHSMHPWLCLVGSRWFAESPDSVRVEVREKLLRLIQWNKWLFNYHPGWLLTEVRTLNRELGFKPGFTEYFLTEPEDPAQTADILSRTFDRLFQGSTK